MLLSIFLFPPLPRWWVLVFNAPLPSSLLISSTTHNRLQTTEYTEPTTPTRLHRDDYTQPTPHNRLPRTDCIQPTTHNRLHTTAYTTDNTLPTTFKRLQIIESTGSQPKIEMPPMFISAPLPKSCPGKTEVRKRRCQYRLGKLMFIGGGNLAPI